MKKLIAVAFLSSFITMGLSFLTRPEGVKAQAPTVGSFAAPIVVASLTQCANPPGVTITFGAAWCFVDTGAPTTDQMYLTENGGTTWTAWPPATASAGVTSFNGRKGVVVSTPGDYSFSQLSGIATTTQLPALVNSFNGRTGNVAPAASDYSFAQLSGSAATTQLPPFVSSFNTRTGAVTLSDTDVTGTGLKVNTTVTGTFSATSTPQ